MICEQSRLQIGADPAGSSAELEEHLRGCAACRQFREETRTLDGRIPKPTKLGSRNNIWQVGQLREALARLQGEAA